MKISLIKYKYYRRAIGHILRALVFLFIDKEVRDTQCGFKLYNKKYIKKVFKLINEKGFAHDIELMLLLKNNKIRLSGIDAPETNQSCKKIFLSIQFLSFHKKYPCGKISTKKLKKLLKNELILCKIENVDRYKRKLATCYKNKLTYL